MNRNKTWMSGSLILSLMIILVVSLTNCGGNGKHKIVKIDGSSTVYPITEAVAEEFQKAHRDIRITVGVSGTGGGFKKFYGGETDISDASRPIKKKEEVKAKEKGIEFIEIPVAYDGLAVVINPKNDWCTSMTANELKILWQPKAQGTIMKWSDIRKGWPDKEIHLFGPGVDSGTFDYFTKAIVGKSQSSRGDFTASEDDNVLVQGIATDKYALGFFGFAYYHENKSRLKLVAIDDEKDGNGKGPIKPSIETVKDSTYQPLSRPIFIYIRKDSLDKKPEVRKFAEFYMKNASILVKEVGYIPLPAKAYELGLKRIKNRITGSVFSGGATIGVSIESLLKKQGK